MSGWFLSHQIIQFLEANGEQSTGKIEDHMRIEFGTLGGTTGRRLRELCAEGKIDRVARVYGDKKYIAYRVAEVRIPIVGVVRDEQVIYQKELL